MRLRTNSVLAALLLTAGCRHATQLQFSALPPATMLPPCPEVSVDTLDWRRHPGRHLSMSLRLPPGFSRFTSRSDSQLVAEVWSDGDELQLSYMYEKRVREQDPGAGDTASLSLQCQMVSGGGVAQVHAFDATGRTVPGFVVHAVWRGTQGERLTLSIISDEPGRRDEMLAIVRSVVFAPWLRRGDNSADPSAGVKAVGGPSMTRGQEVKVR
jgi:hypothetical protein